MEITRKTFAKSATALVLAGATLAGVGAPLANAQEPAPAVVSAVEAQKNPAVAESLGHEAIQTFKDVSPQTTPFYKEIGWIQHEGITTGWPDGTFRPQAKVQRAALVAFLYRLNGSPEVKLPATSPFKDVQPGHQFYKEIVWAHQQGITTGWEDGTFRPWEPISREAMAAFFYRDAGQPAVDLSVDNKFSDVTKSPFYKEIQWFQQQGITTGWPDGTFRPTQSTDRDATAAFLFRYAYKVKGVGA